MKSVIWTSRLQDFRYNQVTVYRYTAASIKVQVSSIPAKMSLKLLSAAVGVVGLAGAAEWAFESGTTATMVLGVGTASDEKAVAAASQNGIGAFVERYNGTKWVKEAVPSGLIMDAAASDSVIVATSMFPVVLSTDGGQTYSYLENIYGLSQSASVFGDGQDIGLVGTFFTSKEAQSSVSGVAHSSDNGSTWDVSEIETGYVRYGSFPSKVHLHLSIDISSSEYALSGDIFNFRRLGT
jgi:hypothetical protein